MFQGILILPFFLFLLYTAVANEKKNMKWLILGYFGLLSIVFMSGGMYISFKYHLVDGLVLPGGFQKYFNWVQVFSYLYIVPLVPFIGYKLCKLSRVLFHQSWVQTLMFAFWTLLLLGGAFVSLFIFILLFYGFAP